jgi:hypothetical protein
LILGFWKYVLLKDFVENVAAEKINLTRTMPQEGKE